MWPLRVLKVVARVLGRVLVVLLKVLLWLPWILLVGLKHVVSGCRLAFRIPRELVAASRDRVVCPRCRSEQSLLGRWRCPVCRSVTTTHAWAPCPVCGTHVPAGYIACATPGCGEAIVNPRLGRIS